jgi:hypothetical protein
MMMKIFVAEAMSATDFCCGLEQALNFLSTHFQGVFELGALLWNG